MSASFSFLSDDAENLRDPRISQVREWERFKWFSRQLAPLRDQYDVEQLEALFNGPPSIPGQQEKVVVLLALERTPQAAAALERIAAGAPDEGLRGLLLVALHYVRQA